MTKIDIPHRIREKLFNKTDRKSSSHWTYPGTGKLVVDGDFFRVHQLWWALEHDGHLPRRLGSTCGVAGCCNPDHWFDATDSSKPPVPEERELKFHRRHGYFYVANPLTGGRQVPLGKDREVALLLWTEGKALLSAGLSWTPNNTGSTLGHVTVAVMCERYLKALLEDVAKGRLVQEYFLDMKNQCSVLVRELGRKTLVTALTRDHFNTLADRMMVDRDGQRRRWGGYAGQVKKFRTIFNQAKKKGIIGAVPDFPPNFPMSERAYEKESNRMTREGATNVRQATKKTFTQPEVQALLDIADPIIRAWVLIGLNLAMTQKELSMLKPGDFRQDINDDWWFEERRFKTGEPRLIHVWPETIEAIQDAMAQRPEPANDSHADLLFLNRDGFPIRTTTGSQFAKNFRRAMIQADVYSPRRGFAALRHTFRTHAGECGDSEAVEWVMGHKTFGMDISDMNSTYVHAMARQRLKKVSAAVHDWMTGKTAEAKPAKVARVLSF